MIHRNKPTMNTDSNRLLAVCVVAPTSAVSHLRLCAPAANAVVVTRRQADTSTIRVTLVRIVCFYLVVSRVCCVFRLVSQ